MTIHTTSFAHPGNPKRRESRPTSGSRHNNPQANDAFKVTKLPTGDLVHVACGLQDGSRSFGVGGPMTLASTHRETFTAPRPDEWQQVGCFTRVCVCARVGNVGCGFWRGLGFCFSGGGGVFF